MAVQGVARYQAGGALNTADFLGRMGTGVVVGVGHKDMYRDIFAFFEDSTHYPVSREDCLGTLRLLHAFYRSGEAGGWVDVDSDDESERLGRADEAISGLYRTPRGTETP